MKAPAVIAVVLAGAVVGSAVAVIYAQHQSRRLFSELETLHRKRDGLNAEWGMLQLEQGAYATHSRIEKLARKRLDMKMPRRDEIVILEP